ncbi:MAG: M20/M25/M40 family metallo-hydrolase [Bacteroidales bacterium]|nr:M20/M25/M40 family metallo-hydrolase [Bacteroidales bacterium]
MKELTRESAELLRQMVAIPSPSFDENEVCDLLCKYLTSKNITHERIGHNIVAEHIADPELPTLLLCAHIDTVMPGNDYSFDPYTPDDTLAAEAVRKATGTEHKPSEIVAGLGSNDDGASVVSMIAAYSFLTENDCYKDRIPNLTLALTCEEEKSGKNGMSSLWPNRLSRIPYAIIGEPTKMQVATSERGLLVIDAEAKGISGHAGNNEGRNAIYIALQDIQTILSHDFRRESPLMGKVNINVTQINAGSAHNIVPDSCRYVIDIRPTEQYTNKEILDELQEICSSSLTPRNLANRSSATAKGSPLLKAAESLRLATFSSPTTSDWMRTGCDAVKMGPGDSRRSHKKDEFVLVSEIEQGIRTYIDFIKQFRHEYDTME